MAEPNNMFPFVSPMGDPEPYAVQTVEPDNAADRRHDGEGVPNVNQHEQSDMDMALEPNKFPRQTGHDSLSDEEAQLS